MKFKVGDKVRLGLNSGIIQSYDPLTDFYDILTDYGFNTKYSETTILAFNQPITVQFKIGDSVRIISKDPFYKSLVNFEGKIIKQHPTSWEVVMTSGPHQTLKFIFDDVDLELLQPQGLQSGVVIAAMQSSLPIFDFDPAFKESLEKVAYNSSKSHTCTWKTYTGLMYKEEYCDCGATKNKRGIFE